MDGNYYDASIHSVNFDGTVVLNWLRPHPDPNHQDGGRRLKTISESGGDDTLHRIVSKADIQMESFTPRAQTGTKAAMIFFRDRPPEDFNCADCRASNCASWASVSFGIYLCQDCAQVHERLGPRTSLVRQINEGWGWPSYDIKYLSVGGNSAFWECLDKYPAVCSMEPAERLTSRFAEFYRRYLDAVCTGSVVPAPVPVEQAIQPAQGDFISIAEAAAAVQEVSRKFESTVQAASSISLSTSRLAGAIGSSPSQPLPSRHASIGETGMNGMNGMKPLRASATRSVSEAGYEQREKRKTKVTC
eukprot:TRINITY_DN20367_c0_g3_i1.p1 TRINITY_DN20367_c0_g3~~TRINITY_DN20367_c0_g3_i1.p1  ORF type:complete len:303 (-),score=50.08 TRINITY_DN20367_c0_g3_i1:73-981(-)